jgi:holo-[acyl-carrier protein] synthase
VTVPPDLAALDLAALDLAEFDLAALDLPVGSIRGVGIDLVQISRLDAALARQPSLQQRLFTTREYESAHSLTAGQVEPVAQLAMFFAAKESVMKALGRGIDSMAFTEIEIGRATDTPWGLTLSGRAALLAGQVGVKTWHLSMTYTPAMAQALVLGLAA